MSNVLNLSVLAGLKAKQTASVTLTHPITGEDLDVGFGVVKANVLGKTSKTYRDHLESKVKAYQNNKSKAKDEVSLEKSRKENIEFAVACTESLEGLSEKPITDKEGLKELYSNLEYYWLLAQVTEAFETDKNFF